MKRKGSTKRTAPTPASRAKSSRACGTRSHRERQGARNGVSRQGQCRGHSSKGTHMPPLTIDPQAALYELLRAQFPRGQSHHHGDLTRSRIADAATLVFAIVALVIALKS